MKKVNITSLGCSKNLVDSEVLAGQLKKRKYTFTENAPEADIIIINTCGFIESAKNESLQAIFEAIKIKDDYKNKQIYVTGCLSQRYKEQLQHEIPEIDAVFGTEDYRNILKTLGDNHFNAENLYQLRSQLTPKHFAFIKISEGCNHTCSFCAIPGIRGKHRSRTIEDILKEAEVLAANGVREILIVSQDTSYYGKDLYGKQKIIELLCELANTKLFEWIRPLYWYPTNFPIEFISLINRIDSIVPYIDMPIQHASDKVLKLMRRAETNLRLKKMFKKFREIRPDIALRTTLILGHPGETADDFNLLLDFLQEIQFDRVGTFTYSDEDGTHAFNLPDKVSRKVAETRRSRLMELQQEISAEKNKSLVNTIQKVIIDSYNTSEQNYIGRTYRDAPEVDNEVLISNHSVDPELIGTFHNILIKDYSEYELYGEFK